MKKKKNLLAACGGVLAVVAVVVIVALVINNNRGVVCKFENAQTTMGYVVNTTYIIHGSDIVSSVDVRYTVNASDEEKRNEIINNYIEQFDYNNSRYGGYGYHTENAGENAVTFYGTIDYNKVKMDKFAEDNVAMQAFLNDEGRLDLNGAKRLYQSSGAVCEE